MSTFAKAGVSIFVCLVAVLTLLSGWVEHATAQSGARRADQRYFPSAEFAGVPGQEDLVPLFEKDLVSLGEPPLDRQVEKLKFRATWFSSFEGVALLRIEEGGGGAASVIYKRRVPVASLDTGEVTAREKVLKREALDKLKLDIQAANFFSLSNSQSVISTDGVFLLVEVNDHGQYRAVLRVIPFAKPIREIAQQAAQLSGIKVDLDAR